MFVIALDTDQFNFVDGAEDTIEAALVQAINETATTARASLAKHIGDQINLPPSYLHPSQGRLRVGVPAKRGRLRTSILARNRATSLARFVTGRVPGQGLLVQVKKRGSPHLLKRAFIMNLKNGNKGLAVRTSGKKPRGVYRPKQLGQGSNLWLLYGPSVNQVFQSAIDAQERPITEINDTLRRKFLAIWSAENA